MSGTDRKREPIKRVLIVGAGSIGTRHARVIRELYPDMEIALLRHAACSDTKSKALGVDHCFVSVPEALSFLPQLAVIANPATFHLSVALQLAAAEVHLLVEKPLSATVAGIQELLDTCRRQGVMLMTGYNMRFMPSLCFFRECVNRKKAGEVISVRAEVGQNLLGWRPGRDYRQTVSAQKKLGGGALLELSHEIDYLTWLFGPVEWVKAHLSQQGGFEIDVEDTAHLILGFRESRVGPKKLVGVVNMDFVRHDTTRTCVVIGEEGSLRWNALMGTVEFFPEGGPSWEEIYANRTAPDYTYQEEIRHVVHCIENNCDPMVTGEDGKAAVELVEAAKESSLTGRMITLPLEK